MSDSSRSDWRANLLGPNEVLVCPSVVTPVEQAELLAWTEAQYRDGKLLDTPPDTGAFSTAFQSSVGGRTRLTDPAMGEPIAQKLIWIPDARGEAVDPLPEIFWRVRRRIVEQLELATLEEDCYKGAFISYIAPGTGVHEHCDARLRIGGERQLILRCNVLVGRPEEGGMPVIAARPIQVPDRGMWVFYPTELVHSAAPVAGSRFRAILSFGFLLRPSDLWDRHFGLAPRFIEEYGLAGDADARGTLLARLRVATNGEQSATQRVDLLAFMLDQRDDFSANQAAESLGVTQDVVSAALIDLQRSGLAESASSRRFGRGSDHGTVTVL